MLREVLVAALAGSIQYTVIAADEYLALPPDWRYPIGNEATVSAAVTDVIYDGARAQALKIVSKAQDREGQNTALRTVTQKCEFQLDEFQTLSFKVKFASSGNAEQSFKVRLTGPLMNLEKVFSSQDAESIPAKEGYRTFTWDLGPHLKEGATSVTSISIICDLQSIPGKGEMDATVIDFAFLRTGAPPSLKETVVAASPWVRTGEMKELEVPLQGWTLDKAAGEKEIEVKAVQILQRGKKIPALQLTYRHGKEPSNITLPFKINADEYNVLTFKAKVDFPPEAKALREVEAPMTGWNHLQFDEFVDNFGVSMQSKNGVKWADRRVPSTHFLQHLDKSIPTEDGFKAFRWDMKNENRTGNKGFDLELVDNIKIMYDNRKLKPGQQVVITIIDPKFQKGHMKTGGDMEKFAEFQRAMDRYQPDYSNSEKYLEAPEDGRLPERLPLVKDGLALAEIVGNAAPGSGPEGQGVFELYSWLFKLTGGVKLPVVAAPSDKDNVKIFVGLEHAKLHFPEDIEFLKNSDGCAIRTKGKNVYIFGAKPKGTLNGVYTFLEGNSDVIWPRPSDVFGSVYTEDPSLAITWGDYRHRPEARNWGWMGRTSGPSFDYQVRNRANYLGIRSRSDFKFWGLFMEEMGGHNLHSFIPFVLWPKHPEYWCEINGVRQHPDGYLNQICLTNPTGKRIFGERVLAQVERSPEAAIADCLNIKIEDNWGSCECSDCLLPIRLPNGTLLNKNDIAFRSTQFFMFLNSVANTIHNNGYPNVQIGTYVYFFTVPIPKIPVTAYLRPYFCSYVRKDHKVPIYAPINDIWWKTLNEWTKVSDKVVVREYTGLFVYFRPLAEVAAYDIRAELALGAREFTAESLPSCSSVVPEEIGFMTRDMDVSAMEYWVIMRLYWDPNADVQQLRKYFIRRTYREAAPEIEKFYETMRQLYYAEKRTSDFEEDHEILRLVVVKGKDAELQGYLDAAMEKVKHPLSKMMVSQIRSGYAKWMGDVRKSMSSEGAGVAVKSN